MLLTPPPTLPIRPRKLATGVSSGNVFPQHVVYWSQHLQSETNALEVNLGDFIRQLQCNALGIIQARDEVPPAEVEDGTLRNDTTFGTTGQTSPQVADKGMSPSAALRGKTTERNIIETATVLDTTPVGLTLDLLQFDGGDLEWNDEEGEGMGEEVGDETDQGKDFLFPIERGLICT